MARSPLFDEFDPLGLSQYRIGELDDFDEFGIIPFNRQPRVEDLMSPDEQASMLQNLAYAGSSGMSALGWLLDTPGAMVRGGLSGGVGKALSALWETSDQRVSGRDLNRKGGLAGRKDNWSNFGGGLLTEIALDPLTYASFGLAPLLGAIAKTKAGKLAQRSGMLAQDLGLAAKKLNKPGKATLMRGSAAELAESMPLGLRDEALQRFRDLAGDQADELLKAPMSRGNRVSIPLLYDGAMDLFGERAGEFMARAADNLGVAAGKTPVLGPAIRSAQAMFDSRRKGLTSERGQWLGRQLTQGAQFADEPASRKLAEAMVNASRGVGADVFRTPEFATALRNYREGYADLIPEALKPFFEPGQPGAVLSNNIAIWQRDAIRAARERGIKLESVKLPNETGYMFRQGTKVDNPRFAPNFQPTKDIGYEHNFDLLGLGVGGRGRRDYTASLPTHVLDRMAMDGALQTSLREATEASGEARTLIDNWLRQNAPEFMQRTQGQGPFDHLLSKIPEDAVDELFEARSKIDGMYEGLADRLRRMPLQHAENKIPFYGNALNDIQQYVRSRARGESAADVVQSYLGENAIWQRASDVPGNTNYTVKEALESLGFDTKVRRKQLYSQGEIALANSLGLQPGALENMSVPKQLVNELQEKVRRSRVPRESQGLLKLFDQFQQSFKSLALLWPARYTRDMYSGSFASATKDALDPLLRDQFRGAAIGRGSYDSIPALVRDLPDYQKLNNPKNLNALRASSPKYAKMGENELLDELMIRKFLTDAGGQGLTQASVVDDLGRMASNLTMKEAAPGLSGPYLQGLGRKMDPRKKVFWNPFAQRTRDGNPNWLLDLGDRGSQASDNFNRVGAYLNRVRKGDSPRAAKALADLTQVNYRPEAFTEFEREVMKRLVPFYSFTKGIAPLVGDELVNRPAGLTGQSIRAINRAAEPREDQHVPEYLRQSVAIPIPADTPVAGLKTPGVTRFLTNIDLPHEGLINLFTPGLGNTLTSRVANSVMKTGQNLLGQTSPVLKGPLEYATDRQFYSGRQLSDLFSMAEKYGIPGGRTVDQLVSNAPGGSRLMGLARQVLDDRISTPEKLSKLAVNTLTGLKFQDVDRDRTVRLAARSALNELLKQAKDVGTYENLFIKPEALEKLTPTEKRQYLLYRVLQSQAAREARERKKAAANDPMAILGVR
jgi:hypothetical protein